MFRRLLASALLVASLASVAVAETYELDGGHTQVGFAADHFSVAHMGGFFTEVSGALEYDAANPAGSTVQITIQTNSLVTAMDARTDALKSDFFLATQRHPEIRFKSTKMTRVDGGMEVVGDLTIRETTRSVSFAVRLRGPIDDPFGMKRIGVEGDLKINRHDYGITFDRKMKSGLPFVGDEVTISIAAEFARKP